MTKSDSTQPKKSNQPKTGRKRKYNNKKKSRTQSVPAPELLHPVDDRFFVTVARTNRYTEKGSGENKQVSFEKKVKGGVVQFYAFGDVEMRGNRYWAEAQVFQTHDGIILVALYPTEGYRASHKLVMCNSPAQVPDTDDDDAFIVRYHVENPETGENDGGGVALIPVNRQPVEESEEKTSDEVTTEAVEQTTS